jgi:hypothetical protein
MPSVKLSTAEKRLIEIIRDNEPKAITIQTHHNGEFAVCVAIPPDDKTTAEFGIGMTFEEAWRGKRTIGSLVIDEFSRK